MTLLAKQVLAGKIYAKMPQRIQRLDFAIAGIRAMLQAIERVYVSISFGKQSSCVAHMVYQINPSIPMYFLASDETWLMYNYREVIDRFLAKWSIDLHIIQTHRFFEADTWKAGRDAGDRDLQNMCPRTEWDGWFWGLAKDEGQKRKYTCSLKNSQIHPTIFRYKDGKIRCTPIQDWELNDLAAYIGEHDIPMLNIYERYGLEMRTTARITKKARDFGANTLLRATNSQGYRQLVNTHREVEQ